MKRKTLTLVLCLLTVLSLVGVGFASWVISADTQKVEQGNIVVDTVADQRLKLTATTTQKDIIFAGASVADYVAPTGAWLTLSEDSQNKVENLTVTYSCVLSYNDNTIKLTDTLTQTGTVKTNVALSTVFAAPTGSDAYNVAVNQCFTAPDNATIENVKINKANTILTFDVKLTYAWGHIFNEANPFDFYNETKVEEGKTVLVRPISGTCNAVVPGVLDANSNWGDHAAHFLGLLEAIDNTASFSITIDAKVDNSNGIVATVTE